jgi:hypothetical protein
VVSGSGANKSITYVGDGWYRCAFTATSGQGSGAQIRWSAETSAGLPGDGTSGIFVWGAQFSNSGSLDPYVYNPGAIPSSTAYYGPRFDYDPVTLAPKGLLIEEQRVNLLFRSEEISDVAWLKPNGDTVSANTSVAPNGTTTMDTFVESASTGLHTLVQSTTITANTFITASVFLKAAGRSVVKIKLSDSADINGVTVEVNLTTGAIATAATAYGTGSSASATITNFGNGVYRCTLTGTVGTGNTTATLRLRSLVTAGGSETFAGLNAAAFIVWGAQLEVGAFATSYIPTVASTVTRAGDSTTMIGSNFSNWYNQSEGTIIVQFVAITNGVNSTGGNSFPFVYDIDSAAVPTSGHSLILSAGYGPGWNTITAILGVAQATLAGSMTLGNANVRKIAYAYRTNDFAASANGGAATIDTLGDLPTNDRMSIGIQNASVGVNNFTGYMQRITYYPTRLTDAQHQALTL